MVAQRFTMPAVKRVRVKGLRGRFRVTLYSRDGTYALSVPKSRLGHLLLPIARAHPFEVRLKSPVSVDVPKGVRPVGKAARKSLTYTPLRPRKRRATTHETAAPTPKIEEVTSAIPVATTAKQTRRGKNKKKQAAAV
jgi:hypothetical protein